MTEHPEHEAQTERSAAALTRRELIKRAAIVGGVAAWGVPLVRLALGDDEDRSVRLGAANAASDGAVAAAFPDTCIATELDPGNTVRLVCAKNQSGAVTAFKSKVKTECAAKCQSATVCTCRTNKRTPTTISTITCTPTNNDLGCPDGLYARGSKEFLCTAVVLCNCECR